jgi:hypothetical protein
MSDRKNNTFRKAHNPKSYSPAVYIPSWLIQVPHNELSFGAKLLYGRLSQWSNTKGTVYRSCPQLSKELGIAERTVEKFIKELKDCGLIGTFQAQAGGSNNYEFYEHEWMHRELAKELDYDQNTPPHNHAAPPAQPCGTPPHNHADINIKEIKTNTNKEIKPSPIFENEEKQKNTFPETYYQTPSQADDEKIINEMLDNNPYKIPEILIRTWFATRKAANKPINSGIWALTIQDLYKYSENGFNPIECFERMVKNGWLALDVKKELDNRQSKRKSKSDTNSTGYLTSGFLGV